MRPCPLRIILTSGFIDFHKHEKICFPGFLLDGNAENACPSNEF
jgi:hypothetical protein